jgi:hypothetical protein
MSFSISFPWVVYFELVPMFDNDTFPELQVKFFTINIENYATF